MKITAGWETIAGALSAGVALLFARADVYGVVSGELVTVLGIMMAAFIPTMLLAATALRAGRFSTARLVAVSSALDRQIALFGGLFLYALVACALIIAGKMCDWHLPAFHLGGSGPFIDLSLAFPSLLTGLLVFLALRSLALVAGIRSLLQLTSAMVLDEVVDAEQALLQREKDELRGYKLPAGYGAAVDLH